MRSVRRAVPIGTGCCRWSTSRRRRTFTLPTYRPGISARWRLRGRWRRNRNAFCTTSRSDRNGLLQMVDIAEAKDFYPSDLSTGYKRAVAIARALAAQPQCVLYDEPTTMVDPIMSDHLGDLM